MKPMRYLSLAFLWSAIHVASAFAFPANKPLTVQLSTVSPSGQLATVSSIAVTSDAAGKVSFSFSHVPTSDTTSFLMIQILDGSTVLRRSIVAAPAPGGGASAGVSEVTDRQAVAMEKAFANAGNGNPTLAMMVLTMVRSGAMSDTDLQNIAPLAKSATDAFENSLAANGAGSQIAAFRTALLPALRDFSSGYKASVDAVTLANDASTADPVQDIINKAASNKAEAMKRGDAMAIFLNDVVNAATDAGISPSLVHIAVTEAGKAVEAGATTTTSDVVAAMLDAFRTAAEQCQLRAEMRKYADALPVVGGTTTQTLQLSTASTAFASGIMTAQESYELTFEDPSLFPSAVDSNFARDTMGTMLQSLTTNFITATTATSGDVDAMLTTMASGMAGMGGSMSGMTLATLQGMGIGSMVTGPGTSSQNWDLMMVAGANFVAPGSTLTYTPATTTLLGQLSTPYVPAVAAPDFTQFADPYRSLLELQYDLTLLKFLNLQAMAQATQPVSAAALAQMKEDDLARRTAVLTNISGLTAAQKDALLTSLSQPELM